MKQQSRVELFRVTSYKDGAVYETVSLGEAWQTIDSEVELGKDEFIASLSTKRIKELGFKGTYRRVEDSVPDLVRLGDRGDE